MKTKPIIPPVLFVGQAPGVRTNPAQPLDGRCGRVLAELLGIDVDLFFLHARSNLIDQFPGKAGHGDLFDERAAAESALKIESSAAQLGLRDIVCLGHKVAAAFGIKGEFLTLVTRHAVGKPPVRFLIFPHPSGVNRWWNDPGNRRRARLALRRFLRQSRMNQPKSLILVNGPAELAGKICPPAICPNTGRFTPPEEITAPVRLTRQHCGDPLCAERVVTGVKHAVYRLGRDPEGAIMLRGGMPAYFFDRWRNET